MSADALIHTAVGPLWVERHGATGPWALLWPSLLCDGWMWRHQVADLARDHRLLVVHPPGHGCSPAAPGPLTIEACAEAVPQVLDARGVARAALIGLSWGGMTAMRVAAAAPGRVSALALVDTSARAEAWGKRLRYRLMLAVYRRFGLVRPLERPILAAMLGATTRRTQPALGPALLERLRGWEPAGVARAVEAVVIRRRDVRAQLPQIACPTLVVVGAEDQATGVGAARELAALIPGARLEVIARAGHLTALEAPAVLTALLREHLAPLRAEEDGSDAPSPELSDPRAT